MASAVMASVVMVVSMRVCRPGPRPARGSVVVPALSVGVGAAVGLCAGADDPPEQEDARDGADDNADDGARVEASAAASATVGNYDLAGLECWCHC